MRLPGAGPSCHAIRLSIEFFNVNDDIFSDDAPDFVLRRDGQGRDHFFPFVIRLFQVFGEFDQFAVQGK